MVTKMDTAELVDWVRERIAGLLAQEQALREDRAAYERVLKDLGRGFMRDGTEKPPTRADQPSAAAAASQVPQFSMQEWARKLNGLRQAEALIRIAEESGGLLRAREAKRILMGTGVAKGSDKNIAANIYHLIPASERFEKQSPGVFRLMPKDE